MYNWNTVLLTLGVLVGLKIWSPYLVDNIKWSYFDVLHQQKESQLIDNIVLVDIDEKSLDKYGQYPWPRNIYSDIMLENHHTNTLLSNRLFNRVNNINEIKLMVNNVEQYLIQYLKKNDFVNVELDIFGKYIYKYTN